MNRPLLLCAVLLLLSACSLAGTAGTPENGSQSRTGALAQSTQVLLSTEEPRATATPDAAGTYAMAALNLTQEERNSRRQIETETKSVYMTQGAYIAQTATLASPAGTARAKEQARNDAMVAANMTQSADHATQTYVAPRDEATAAYLRENVKWASVSAVVDWLAMLLGGTGVFAIGGALAYVALTRSHIPVAETDEEEPVDDSFGLGDDLLPIPDAPEPCPLVGEMLMHYIDYAMSNAPLGVQNAGAALTGIVDRGSCWAMVNWLDGRKYTTIERVKETNANYSKKVLNDNGRQWCKDEREKPADPTALPQE